MGSQNNIRNNQNFNICNSTRRHCSTNNIKRSVEPGGSTLSRSIFAFLENRDNTNVDSNPTKTSMNLKNSAQEKFQIGPMPPPSLPSVPGHLAPTDRARDGRGKLKRAASPSGGRTIGGRATQPQTPPSPVQTVARQRVSPRLSTGCPTAPRRLAVPASFAFSRLTCWILV